MHALSRVRRARAAIALMALALVSGCVGESCAPRPTYAHAYVPLVPMPDEAALDAALESGGWTVRDGPGAYATFHLPEDRIAVLHLGIPTEFANGSGLFVSVVDSLVVTEGEARDLLEPAVEPLARALGSPSPIYRGGGEHCGEV